LVARSSTKPAWAQFPWARTGLYERAYQVRLDLVIALQSGLSPASPGTSRPIC
jgi:hypothetical protein